MKFEINGCSRNVIVHHKRMKSIVLRIDENGNFCVNFPSSVTEKKILSFLGEKTTWIFKTERQQNRKKHEMKCGIDGEVTLLGKTYSCHYVQATQSSIRIEDNQFIFASDEFSKENIQALFYMFAAEKMAKMINELRIPLDEEICMRNGKALPNITVKYMTSRWGSCTPAKSRISMSVRLIHYPKECLKYVLIHEYAHILVPNHSSAFYDVVREFMPNYKYYSDLLNH